MAVAKSQPSKPPIRSAYQLIMADMVNQIHAGRWRLNERIPTIDKLAEAYPYSRMTVVRAMRELVEAGYLETRGKGGTVVIKSMSRPRIGILSRYDFSTPEQTRFTHTVTCEVRALAEQAGYDTALFQEDADWDKPGYPNRELLAADGDESLIGIMTISSNTPAWRQKRLGAFASPCVDISYIASPHCVYIDYQASIAQAVKMAKKAGRKSIGLISNAAETCASMLAAAQAAGLECNQGWIAIELQSITEETGYRSFRELWKAPHHPEAVFVLDDVTAKGAAQAAVALGIEVPKQLLLMTLANQGIEYFYPCPVSRLEISPASLAQAAFSLLQELQKNRSLPPRQIKIGPASVDATAAIAR